MPKGNNGKGWRPEDKFLNKLLKELFVTGSLSIVLEGGQNARDDRDLSGVIVWAAYNESSKRYDSISAGYEQRR